MTNLYQTAMEAFQSGGRELFNALGIQDKSSIASHDWKKEEDKLTLYISRKNGGVEEKEFAPPVEEVPIETVLSFSEATKASMQNALNWIEENSSSLDELYERYVQKELDFSDTNIKSSVSTFYAKFEEKLINLDFNRKRLKEIAYAAMFHQLDSSIQMKYLPLPSDEE